MRIYLLVLDGLGVGAATDCVHFGDTPSVHTLQHVIEGYNCKETFPILDSLGLFTLQSSKKGVYRCILSERSLAKDTITGHQEMMGVITKTPPRTFDDALPEALIKFLHSFFCMPTLCNHKASGTEIIQQLGEEHLKTGYPIVYTSADSVLQIAAHRSVWSEEHLHEVCFNLRQALLEGPFAVGRIIARPFDGNKEEGFYRTLGRHDYSLPTPEPNTLTRLLADHVPIYAIGKIRDIFTIPFTASYPGENNETCYRSLFETLQSHHEGLFFANLVDFDALCGHRRDKACFVDKLKACDDFLSSFLPQLHEEDILILTADHGCDPTASGTDHTRENVPCIFYQKALQIPDSHDRFLGEYVGFDLIGKFIERCFSENNFPLSYLINKLRINK